jgi:periplasmic divalent cation tolerance protein
MKPLFIYMTAKDRKQARAIGRALVEERLAACVNILDGMNSFYFWEGNLCDERETVIIAKTTDARLPRLVERVKRLHSYRVPCIAALPIAGGNRDFLQWIALETASPGIRTRKAPPARKGRTLPLQRSRGERTAILGAPS